MMKFPALALTCSLLASLVALPSLAQTTDDNLYQKSENSSIFGNDNGFNPFNIIHNSRLNGGLSSEQFQRESDRNLDNAAENYRQSLMDYWRQQKGQQQTPAATNGDRPEAVQEVTP